MKHKRSTFREQRTNRDKRNNPPHRMVSNVGGDKGRAALVNAGMKYLIATMPKPHTDYATTPDERVRLAAEKRGWRGARNLLAVRAGGIQAV